MSIYNFSNSESICFIGIGSNLNSPVKQIEKAFKLISTYSKIKIISKSSMYISKPLEFKDQPDYINCVISVVTKLTPYELLKTLQEVERNQGRVRKEKWGARTIDLDILLYGNEKISDKELTIPHPEIYKRHFVVYPLAEISNNLVFPDNQHISEVIKKCPVCELKKI